MRIGYNVLLELILLFAGVLGPPVMFFTMAEMAFFRKGRLERVLTGVFLGSLLLLFPGNYLLGLFGLTWRNGPGGFLGMILLYSGVGVALTAIGWIRSRKMADWKAVGRIAVKAMVTASSLLVCIALLNVGPLFLAVTYGQEERVLEHQGQLLVETYYAYYEYRGPLFRGTKQIAVEFDGPPEGD